MTTLSWLTASEVGRAPSSAAADDTAVVVASMSSLLLRLGMLAEVEVVVGGGGTAPAASSLVWVHLELVMEEWSRETEPRSGEFPELEAVAVVPVIPGAVTSAVAAAMPAGTMAIEPRRESPTAAAADCCLARSSPAAVDMRAAVPAASISAVDDRPRFSLLLSVVPTAAPVAPATTAPAPVTPPLPGARMFPRDFFRLLFDLARLEAW